MRAKRDYGIPGTPIFENGADKVAGDLVTDTTQMHELLGLGPRVSLNEGLRLTAGETP